MAKQCGPILFRGCKSGISFYRMEGVYYARAKSSLTGKRVKKDPAFRRTMAYAALLRQASPLASVVYRQRPAGVKDRRLYQSLSGTAMRLLQKGLTAEEVLQVLSLELAASLPAQAVIIANKAKTCEKNTKKESRQQFAEAVLEQIFETGGLPQRPEEALSAAEAPP